MRFSILANRKFKVFSLSISTHLGSSGWKENAPFHNELTSSKIFGIFFDTVKFIVDNYNNGSIEVLHNNATLKFWQQSFIQETLLRLKLERKFREMKKDFKTLKKNLKTSLNEAKTQDILNQQLINIIIPQYHNSIQRVFWLFVIRHVSLNITPYHPLVRSFYRIPSAIYMTS